MSNKTTPERDTKLWLIRHGETVWNTERRIQGHKDSPLSSRGTEQVQRLADRLRGEAFDCVYSSDSGRALQTARTVFPDAGIKLDERLRELSYGVLEGKTDAEYTQKEREMRQAMRDDPYTYQVTGGESWRDLMTRVEAWLSSLENGRVVAFSHGWAIRAAIFVLIGHQPKGHEWKFAFDNTGMTRVHLTDTSNIILGLNDTAHLEDFCG